MGISPHSYHFPVDTREDTNPVQSGRELATYARESTEGFFPSLTDRVA